MEEPLLRRDELSSPFRDAEKSRDAFRIGAESEKFGVHAETGRPLGYGGDFSVCEVLTHLSENHGWSPIQETPESPVIGLRRGGASITLEPSAQLELSGAPLRTLHEVAEEAAQHRDEIRPVSERMNLAWLGTGFHPLCTKEELPWVPKQRYPIMREYLPTQGSAGLDMMQRTATVQGNFDWSSEADGMQKLRVALKLSPLLQAWFSNAPFKEKSSSGTFSHRGHVWTHMDPTRSGLIHALWSKQELSYDDYVEWALDAGMFLIWRDGQIVKNTGQTFRDFLENGHQGHRATLADWKLHLTTLFPEVRMKNTLEVRSVDGQLPADALASLAIWTGVLYDEQALDETCELLEPWSVQQVESERAAFIDRGLHGELCGQEGFSWASRVLEIATEGLERRAYKNQQGKSEAVYLAPAVEILEKRTLPAERALSSYEKSGSLIEATRIQI